MLSLIVSGAMAQSLTVADITTEAGQEATITVAIEGAAEMTALQFNLSLPEGFALAGDITLGSAARGHTLSVSPLTSGDQLVVLYSLQQGTFADGTLVTIPVVAAEDAVSGEARLYTVHTATAAAVSHTLSDVTFAMNVVSEVTITMNKYGSGTYSSEHALDFSKVEGLKAYAATGYNSVTGVVTLTRVMTAKAGTGLFLKGEQGDYTVPVMTSTADNSLNMLVATLEKTPVNGKSDDGMYINYKYTVLSGTSTPLFYQFTDGSSLGAGKAYLQIPTAWMPDAAQKSISIRFDEGDGTTDIEDAEFNTQNSELIYDLMGRRVEKAEKGIYIVGGRKVIK